MICGNSPYNSPVLGKALSGSLGHFANPFLDLASLSMPQQNRDVLEWCEHIWDSQETYREAVRRKIAYFLTDVEVSAVDARKHIGEDERRKWQRFLSETLGIKRFIQNMDSDRECYGNAFASLLVGFKRMLVCPQCKSQFALNKVYTREDVFNFHWDFPDFIASCPKCELGRGYRGKFELNDVPMDLENNLRLHLWNPKDIEILHDLVTGECAYLMRIPQDYKQQLREGHLHNLERVPSEMLKAAAENRLFRFHDDSIFHMHCPVVSGRRSRGWGISPIIRNFRQIWYVQVLRRYNEALAMDYIIPFRLITPDTRGGTPGDGGMGMSDPLRLMNSADFTGEISRMIARRRRDPSTWNFLPFPVRYQAMGGDATQLAPSELLEQGYDTMLNGAGVFSEMYRGTMQLQTAPTALRLFEASNTDLVYDNNEFLFWLTEKVATILSWEQVSAKMQRVTHSDNFEKQMAILQMVMAQSVSQTTGLSLLGLDWGTEQRRIAEEARQQAQTQAEVQEEMEQASFGEQIAKGQAQAGGAPQQGGAGQDPSAQPAPGQPGAPGPVTGLLQSGNVPQSLDDMVQTAEALASELLGLPESQKDSELRALKQKNPTLHALVRAKMDEQRQQYRNAGGQMLMQSNQAQMGGQ